MIGKKPAASRYIRVTLWQRVHPFRIERSYFMQKQLSISATLTAPPDKVYEAYLSSTEHAAMTGSAAKIENRISGTFMAWDGYITGTITELVKNRKIVQAWRTTDFEADDPDSILELSFEGAQDGKGTKTERGRSWF
jgi:activator of HSP90 ATPase